MKYKHINKLKSLNYIYQGIGIIILIVFTFFKLNFIMKILLVFLMSFIVIRLFKLFKNRVIELIISEDRIQFKYFNGKKTDESINILTIDEQVQKTNIYKNHSIIVSLNRYDWKNFEPNLKVLKSKLNEYKKKKSPLKDFAKEIIKSEIEDPTSFN